MSLALLGATSVVDAAVAAAVQAAQPAQAGPASQAPSVAPQAPPPVTRPAAPHSSVFRYMSPEERAQLQRPVEEPLVVFRNSTAAEREREKKKAQLVRGYTVISVAGLIGLIAGGAGGALLWPTHRFVGALLGSLLVGAPAGATVGTIIAANDMKDIR